MIFNGQTIKITYLLRLGGQELAPCYYRLPRFRRAFPSIFLDKQKLWCKYTSKSSNSIGYWKN